MGKLKYHYEKLLKLKRTELDNLSNSEIIDLYILDSGEIMENESFCVDDKEYNGTIVGFYSACDQEICRMLLEDGSSIYIISNNYLSDNVLVDEEKVAQLIKRQTRIIKKKKERSERTLIYTLVCILAVLLIVFIYRSQNANGEPIIKMHNNGGSAYSSTADLYNGVNDSVVLIYVYGDTIEQYGSASGMIITEDGYLISCAHIYNEIENPHFKVITGDGKRYETVFVAGDVESDICLLKIVNPDNVKFSPITLGNSNNIDFGDRGIILGFPGGSTLRPIVTEGLISAPSVGVRNSLGYELDCIQTSAVANPGSSGGGLFDGRGRVIGMITSKYAAGNYENTIYCVPSATIEYVVNKLFFTGYVSRPTLGISFITTNEIDIDNGLPYGGILMSIADGSPLKDLVYENEIITHVNGKEITLVYDFYDAFRNIDESNPDVTIKVYNQDNKDYRDVSFTVNFRISSSGYNEK